MPEQKPQPGAGRPEEKWRPRRPSPLGLMGPQSSEVPKANPLPSARAVGIMVAFMAVVVALVLLFARSC